MSDREQRQFPLMQQRIEGFRDGRLSIGTVIGDLEGLASALDETSQEWKDPFIAEWSVLEVAYAVALDRQQPVPTAGDHDVAAALDALELLMRSAQGTARRFHPCSQTQLAGPPATDFARGSSVRRCP